MKNIFPLPGTILRGSIVQIGTTVALAAVQNCVGSSGNSCRLPFFATFWASKKVE